MMGGRAEGGGGAGGRSGVAVQTTQDAFILYKIQASGTFGRAGRGTHGLGGEGGRGPDSLSSPPIFLCLHAHAPLHYLG